MSRHVWQHGIQYFFIECGCSGVIEINTVHSLSLSNGGIATGLKNKRKDKQHPAFTL
jgi:hypothetical protein